MATKKDFVIPKTTLTQLSEFTTGYFLITLDENSSFKVYHDMPTDAVELAIINFMDIQATTMQEVIRQRAINSALNDGDDDIEIDFE